MRFLPAQRTLLDCFFGRSRLGACIILFPFFFRLGGRLGARRHSLSVGFGALESTTGLLVIAKFFSISFVFGLFLRSFLSLALVLHLSLYLSLLYYCR